MEWIEQKKREIARLKTTFHFAEAVEGLLRDLLLQHELNHHLYLQAQAPLPAILRVITQLEEDLEPGQALETLWVLSGMEDPDGLFFASKTRLFSRVEQSIRSITDHEVQYRWGSICFQTGHLDKLGKLLARGILDESDYRVVLLKARLAIATRQFELGLEILEPLTDEFPEAIHHRAGLYWRAGSLPHARMDFQRLLHMRFTPAFKDAAKFYLATQEPGRALEAALQLPGLKRLEPESRILLAAAWLQLGETGNALKELMETQNDIWARGFPIKYDSDFRLGQDLLRKALFQAGVEAGKVDLLAEMASHPQFQPESLPVFLRNPMNDWGVKGYLADIHYLAEWIRNPEKEGLMAAYKAALERQNDPRHTLLQKSPTEEPTPIPNEWERKDEIHLKWFGGQPATALFKHGLPHTVHLAENGNVTGTEFFPWRLTVTELDLTSTSEDPTWLLSIANRQMPRLRKLTLRNVRLDYTLAQIWASNPGLRQVKHLHLSGGIADMGALQYLLGTADFRLHTLIIEEMPLIRPMPSQDGLGDWLAKHPGMMHLQQLEIRHSTFTAEDLTQLALAPLPQLQTLIITHQELGSAEIAALPQSPWWASLRHLDFSFTGLELEIAKWVMENHLPLDFLGCQSEEDHEEWEVLQNHPHWDQIGVIQQ